MKAVTNLDLVRALQQRLDDLRMAGVSHLPRADFCKLFAVEEDKQEDKAVAKRSGSGRSRQQRLAAVAKAVARCTRCPELVQNRTQTVFGVGNPNTSIVFVGEAPGADEDRQGEPFVGAAGQLLNKIIEACQLKREDIYITNVVKCRPPRNRTPTAEECANCLKYLKAQLEIIQPDYIVCWGTTAAQTLLGTKDPIGRLRGRFFQYGNAKVVCTYHPSYLLRYPPAKRDVWEDMKFWRKDMGVVLKDAGKAGRRR